MGLGLSVTWNGLSSSGLLHETGDATHLFSKAVAASRADIDDVVRVSKNASVSSLLVEVPPCENREIGHPSHHCPVFKEGSRCAARRPNLFPQFKNRP